jgi:oxygen-independent coproporphyrinogen-3 oxidase
MIQALDDGRLKRNFQGYTTDRAETLLGFGASSIGTLSEGYVQNAIPFRAYEDAIRNNQLAVTRGVRRDADDRLRGAVIERLMCDLVVDLDDIAANFAVPVGGLAAELSALAPMERDGLVEIIGSRIRITEDGRPLMRLICAVFDRYLCAGQTRHSRAV